MHTRAQPRDIAVNYETWWGLMTTAQYSKRMSMWNDFHHVNGLFWIARTGLNYHNPKDNIVATAGYGMLGLGTPWSDGALIRREHRPWGQVVYRWQPVGNWSFSNRFRYDARFFADLDREAERIQDSYSFNHRWRFNAAVRYSFGNLISPSTIFSLGFLNESLISTGPGNNGFPFEHRTHLMANLRYRGTTYSLGYIGRYIEVNDQQARINHGLVVWVSLHMKTKRYGRTFIELPGEHSE